MSPPEAENKLKALSSAEAELDSAAVIHQIRRGAPAKAARHIDLRWRWIFEKCQKGHINVAHISGEDNPADFFTKAQCAARFQMLAEMTQGLPWALLSKTIRNARVVDHYELDRDTTPKENVVDHMITSDDEDLVSVGESSDSQGGVMDRMEKTDTNIAEH